MAAPKPESPTKQTEIIFFSDFRYGTDVAEPVNVTVREHCVCQAFLAKGPMDKPTLEKHAGFPEAVKVLTSLKTRYGGIFAEAIKLPGARGKGGYQMAIRRA